MFLLNILGFQISNIEFSEDIQNGFLGFPPNMIIEYIKEKDYFKN